MRLSGAEKAGFHREGRVYLVKLVWPGAIDILTHGFYLPRAHVQVGQAILAGGHDVQSAGKIIMVM